MGVNVQCEHEIAWLTVAVDLGTKGGPAPPKQSYEHQ